MLNYLAKAAPINLDDLKLKNSKEFVNMFQLGFFDNWMSYNREVDTFKPYLIETVNDLFGPKRGFEVFFTDTKEFQLLLPLMFHVIFSGHVFDETSLTTGHGVATAINSHIENHGEDFLDHYLDTPLLCDFTGPLEDVIRSSGDKDFKKLVRKLERYLEDHIGKAIEEISKTHPHECYTRRKRTALRSFIRANIHCICRASIADGIGVVYLLSIFFNEESYKISTKILEGKINNQVKALNSIELMNFFLSKTGIRLGAVSGRIKVFHLTNVERMISFESEMKNSNKQMVKVTNSSEINFERNDILESKEFRLLKTKLSEGKDAFGILGNATILILEGLLNEIPFAVWQEKGQDPQLKKVVSVIISRLINHFSQATASINDYGKFCQAIELIHYEIAALLFIFQPFKLGDFQTSYLTQLKVIPDELKPHSKVGIGKSAMNVFAGINAAVREMVGNRPQRVYGEDSYFENVVFIGQNQSLQTNLFGPSDHIDLYVGEHSHNISIDPQKNHYTFNDVRQEIDEILRLKPNTQHLTVAIDSTIDMVNASHIKKLLEHFSEEIQEGRLNFVIFRSGQKFDMLGMDNYYGAPFYMVNNGSDTWRTFECLFTEEVFKADPLSLQWFSLVNKYAFEKLEEYRTQFFKNTRAVLDKVPEGLLPGKNSKIKICTVDDAMEASFIDIKIIGGEIGEISQILQSKFYEIFAAHGIKAHSRGSFGFYHPNINIIPDKDNHSRNIRINPGLNPEDGKILIEYLEALDWEFNKTLNLRPTPG